MVPPDFPKLFWLGWLLAFCVFEFYAVHSGQVDWTFSATAQWLLGAGDDNREWFRTVARVGVVILLLWLIPHFLNRWGWFDWWDWEKIKRWF